MTSLIALVFSKFLYGDLLSFFAGVVAGLAAALIYIIQTSGSDCEKEVSVIKTQHSQLLDAVETLDEGFLLFDKNQQIVVANKRVRDLYTGLNARIEAGADRKELTLAIRDWFKDTPQIEVLNKHLDALNQKRIAPRTNLKWKFPNGKHVQVTERLTHDRGMVAILRDITEQNQKQIELEEKGSLLSTVFENIPIGVCVYDYSLRVVSWNQNYLDIMDVDPDFIFVGIHMQQHLESIFSAYEGVGDSPQRYAAAAIRQQQESLFTRVERKTKSGKIVEIQRSSLPDGGCICTFTDITLTKSAQLMLEESETRHRKMVELSPDAILVQKDGLIIFANVAAIKLLGAKDLHSLIGNRVHKYFPRDDHEILSDHFGGSDHLNPGDNIAPITSRVISYAGTDTDVELEATALLYGEKPVMQIIVRDISAQKEAEEILKKAKEEAEYVSQLKGTFLANMSHELRTPLNAVIGFSEIIKNEIFGRIGSEKYIEYASDIHASGIHLLDLINDILDLSKIEAGTQKLVDSKVQLENLVQECMRLTNPQREKAHVNLDMDLSALSPVVTGDSKMLKQVVINLLSNAIKFTPQGGNISVYSSILSDGSLTLTVEDTGIGIKPGDIQKALTPFVQIDSEMTRKYNGTGLGLPLSKNLMELHGGTLKITSTYGSGTAVTITLPQERVERTAA
ncbi:MAG: PAS-domain containing protein [Sneathiella sp.]